MKHNLFLLFSLLLVNSCFAQELISTAGDFNQSTNYLVSWSIGEPVTETFHDNDYLLTQGFHQTKLTITSVVENGISNVDFEVFPNPTSEIVKIKTEKNEEEFEWIILDNKGVLIDKGTIKKETQISVNTYKQGIYFLNLQNENQTKQTFKIIKH